MVFEGEQLAEADLMSARVRAESTPRSHWFSDLAFHWNGSLTVKKTGRRITFNELTPGELAKFFAYLGVVLAQSGWRGLSGVKGPSLYFPPERPRPWHVVWSALALARMRIASSPEEADAIFYFEDFTTGAAPVSLTLPVLNGALTDISKSKVATAFEHVAGYKLQLDPHTHHGLAVEKSEANGAHDGRLVECPRKPAAGMSYQAFIESDNGVKAYDYRTTIIARRPRFVLVKTRSVAQRFSIHNSSVHYRELEAVFSPAEVRLLTAFAEDMALDWAAIDVLRDKNSGRIYVVDVNKTDTGPAVDLSFRDREKLKAAISAGLTELVAGGAKTL